MKNKNKKEASQSAVAEVCNQSAFPLRGPTASWFMCSATAVAGGFTAFSPLNRTGGSGGGSFGGVCSHSNGRMKVMWLGHKASSQHGRTGGTWWREENEIARYSHPKMFSPFHQTAWVTVSEPPVCLSVCANVTHQGAIVAKFTLQVCCVSVAASEVAGCKLLCSTSYTICAKAQLWKSALRDVTTWCLFYPLSAAFVSTVPAKQIKGGNWNWAFLP